jgi:hypothetical protein
MVAQVLCAFWVAGLTAALGLPRSAFDNPLIRVALALAGWQVLCSLLLVRPLLARSPTAWAAVQGVLLCVTAADLAGLLLLGFGTGLLRSAPSAELWRSALRGTIELLLCWHLFRARAWFGVGDREGWRVLWRRGWWALLVTGGLSLAYLTGVAMLLQQGRLPLLQ